MEVTVFVTKPKLESADTANNDDNSKSKIQTKVTCHGCRVFRYLRTNCYGINDSEFVKSFDCNNCNIIVEKKNYFFEARNMFFCFYTFDRKYIIMTINSTQASVLNELIPYYVDFMSNQNASNSHQGSIYNMFCGLYSMKLYNVKYYFLVSKNEDYNGTTVNIEKFPFFANVNNLHDDVNDDESQELQQFLIRRSNATIVTNNLDDICRVSCKFSDNKHYVVYDNHLDAIKNYQLRISDCKDHEISLSYAYLAKGTIVQRCNNIVYLYDDKYFWKVYVTENIHFYRQAIFYIECDPYCIVDLISEKESTQWLYFLFKLVTKYSMIFSLITDILLIQNVYSNNDHQFFTLAVIVMVFPLIITSVYISYGTVWNKESKDDKNKAFSQEITKLEYIDSKIHLIPIFNIPYYLAFGSVRDSSDTRAALISMLLAATMTYPLYIINLSYLLEQRVSNYHDLSLYNIAQVITALIVLCVTPFTNLLTFLTESYIKKGGLILSFKDKLFAYFIIGLFVIPAMIIEIVHFFPLLFAYYVDNVINYQTLIVILLIFNVPKVGFVVHMLRKFDNSSLLVKILIVVVFLMLPLIPYMLIMIEKTQFITKPKNVNLIKDDNNSDQIELMYQPLNDSNNSDVTRKSGCCKNTMFKDGYFNSQTNYYWHIVGYLWISYGASSFALLIFSNHKLSNFVFALIAVVLVLTSIITCSMPWTGYYVGKLAPHGIVNFSHWTTKRNKNSNVSL